MLVHFAFLKLKKTVFIHPIKVSLYRKDEERWKLAVIFEDTHSSGRHRFTFTKNQREAENRLEKAKKQIINKNGTTE